MHKLSARTTPRMVPPGQPQPGQQQPGQQQPVQQPVQQEPGWANTAYRGWTDEQAGEQGWNRLLGDVESDAETGGARRWQPTGSRNWLQKAWRHLLPAIPGITNRPYWNRYRR